MTKDLQSVQTRTGAQRHSPHAESRGELVVVGRRRRQGTVDLVGLNVGEGRSCGRSSRRCSEGQRVAVASRRVVASCDRSAEQGAEPLLGLARPTNTVR